MGKKIKFFLSKYKIFLLFLSSVEEERTDDMDRYLPIVRSCDALDSKCILVYSGRVCES